MKKIKAIVGLLLLMTGQAVAQTAEYDTDRGFIHPGGLHTQADFDRVKAQLEAGNTKVKQAWQKLTSSEFSQSSVQTYPTEIIVRGGSGENYMNAARGAAMAYQNALRWKIAGTKANANAAVRILMAWARTTKGIGGDSNYALAAGLYGYQFAQAAELMRDYEGWSREDFSEFQRWMLNVWYPSAIGFLRRRNGTWENADKWWQAPGHYWSNWGLCNALCVISIGVLCDDVFIYNQGMSYFKYDQCGTFKDPRTEVPIKNDGLTEFLGNFVVTTYESELETGAYGLLGQLNESGRDAGHSSMSLGVALDVAKVGWNQGDDLFAYMNHRIAAGIEYLAAQSLSVEGLPWVDYIYGTNGYYYTDSRTWTMTEPAMGAQMRPYWGTVIGIYEGVKGVEMPFSEQAYTNMGIDGGGSGSTSGGYDHLGFSVLMNTRNEQLCPAENIPTELSPKMEYGGTINANLIPSLTQEKTRKLVVGTTIYHNELGGLVNTYSTNNKTGVPKGTAITLMPQLPEGEEDTGNWLWNTGEITRNLTITADKSYIYRVTYTNYNGVKSQLAFSIFVQGDCIPSDDFSVTIKVNNAIVGTNEATVVTGNKVTLSISGVSYGSWEWWNGSKAATITTGKIERDTIFTITAYNQGEAAYTREIKIHVRDDDRPTSGLLYYHDFETEPDEDGLLPDSLGFYPATLSGTAKRRFLDDGNWAVFTGNNKGYIDLGETIGTDVMSQLKTNYTISLDLCVTTSNSLSSFCWAWALSNGTSQYSALVNKSGGSNWYYEIKDGTAYQVNSNSSLTVNKWHTITLVQKGTTATLYIDGVQKGTATISLKPTTFGYQLTNNWIGRSPFASDAYMTNTYMDNLRIYNTALTADEVQTLADQRPTSKTVGDPTGIKDIENEKWKMGNVAYNLQGRPLSLPSASPVNSVLPKGIYIIDGKKVFIK